MQPEQKEETRIQKTKDRLRNLWDISKYANIWITGMPEWEEEEQEIEILFEKIIKENFPNFENEIDKHRESQTSWTPKEEHTKTHHS